MFDLEDILGSVVKSATRKIVRATAKKAVDAYHSRLIIDREAIIKAAEQMPQRNVGIWDTDREAIREALMKSAQPRNVGIFGGTYGHGEIERKSDKIDGNKK